MEPRLAIHTLMIPVETSTPPSWVLVGLNAVSNLSLVYKIYGQLATTRLFLISVVHAKRGRSDVLHLVRQCSAVYRAVSSL